MQFKIAFILLAITSLASAQSGGGVTSPAPGTGGAGATNNAAAQMGAMIADLPQCFTTCATTASTASTVGCKGLTDLPCVCSKETFLNVTMTCIASSGQADCKSVSKNATALEEGKTVFTNLCKQAAAAAGGAKAGANAGGMNMTGMTGMPGMENTTTTGGSNASSTGGAPASTATSGHSGASSQHVLATATIISSALLAGIATLL